MTIKIGINGFGRIGRQVTKALFELYKDDFDLVLVNDLTDSRTNAHLFKYDSTYGRFDGTVEYDESSLTINGDKIKVMAEKDPARLPWKDLGVDIVVESTGVFTDATKARAHLDAG
ncbi:MAG TPA: glyceraldehyde 3-phosphate dehydrogenase NAD-binding domain-containing protein, partial [Anaerolineae bacterium]|nr:glyceraldehyde 3-phosphate dehydrogenase NAD-binding domain-containing protein [Anaerolineae bacterium]